MIISWMPTFVTKFVILGFGLNLLLVGVRRQRRLTFVRFGGRLARCSRYDKKALVRWHLPAWREGSLAISTDHRVALGKRETHRKQKCFLQRRTRSALIGKGSHSLGTAKRQEHSNNTEDSLNVSEEGITYLHLYTANLTDNYPRLLKVSNK